MTFPSHAILPGPSQPGANDSRGPCHRLASQRCCISPKPSWDRHSFLGDLSCRCNASYPSAGDCFPPLPPTPPQSCLGLRKCEENESGHRWGDCALPFGSRNSSFGIFHPSQLKPTALDSEVLAPDSQQIIAMNQAIVQQTFSEDLLCRRHRMGCWGRQ